MTVAALMNVPGTQQELNRWAFAHMAHHRDCIRAAQNAGATAELDEFILDPIDVQNGFGQWIYTHQTMHNQMNAVLGVQGFDLTNTNWSDKDQFASFIENNENEHYQWATILGVG